MAEIDCQQSCRQRHVIERLADTLERITDAVNTASVGRLTEEDLSPKSETSPASDEIDFPDLGVHRKQKTTPFLQIDRGATVIISDNTTAE